jgi:hypothetical protein
MPGSTQAPSTNSNARRHPTVVIRWPARSGAAPPTRGRRGTARSRHRSLRSNHPRCHCGLHRDRRDRLPRNYGAGFIDDGVPIRQGGVSGRKHEGQAIGHGVADAVDALAASGHGTRSAARIRGARFAIPPSSCSSATWRSVPTMGRHLDDRSSMILSIARVSRGGRRRDGRSRRRPGGRSPPAGRCPRRWGPTSRRARRSRRRSRAGGRT